MNPELAALQEAIQVLHRLMQVMSDPQAVAVVGTCLKNLTGLQQQMMQGAQQGGSQGAPPGAAMAGGPGASNPLIAALAAHLQGGGAPAPAGP
jgi:hypothetical protein